MELMAGNRSHFITWAEYHGLFFPFSPPLAPLSPAPSHFRAVSTLYHGARFSPQSLRVWDTYYGVQFLMLQYSCLSVANTNYLKEYYQPTELLYCCFTSPQSTTLAFCNGQPSRKAQYTIIKKYDMHHILEGNLNGNCAHTSLFSWQPTWKPSVQLFTPLW